MSDSIANSVTLWQKAASFAARHHAGQQRKDGVTPYVAHPVRVALTVQLIFECHDAVAVCTALLHDTIEDTLADYDDIRVEFGGLIAECVACVTKDKRLPDELREPAFYEQISSGPWQARLVKLADAYDNVSDATDDAMRRRAAAKAREAIRVAGDEAIIIDAISKLQDLLSSFELA